MDDYNQNNINQPQQNNENREPEDHSGNAPEYSFWAEQMNTNRGYNGYTGRTNTMNYGYTGAAAASAGNGFHEKKNHKFLKGLGKSVCFGVLAAAAFLGIMFVYDRFVPDTADSGKSFILGAADDIKREEIKLQVGSTEPGTVKTVSESSVMKVAEDTMPSIVSITSISTETDMWFGMEYPNEGSGSGIIVGMDEKELLIATNNHVVDGTDKITVTFIDDTQVDAVIKGTDATADLAVITVDLQNLKKDTLDRIEVAKLGSSDDIKVGEMTIAIGNALGYGQSLTVGYVSAKDRKVEVSDNYSYKTMILLQTDAAINPGNSGGALLNVDGEVIGINTIKFADFKIEGMGYAIPISRAIPIINELMEREILKPEEQGFLGVGPTDVTEEVSEMFGIPIGVYISTIVEDSSAEKAGLMVGDVIQSIDGVEVTSGVQLREMISSIRTGTKIEVKLMRRMDGGYKEMTVTVELGSRPADTQ